MRLPKVNGPMAFKPSPDSEGRGSREYWERSKKKKKYSREQPDLTGWVLPDQETESRKAEAQFNQGLRRKIIAKYLKLFFFVFVFWMFSQVLVGAVMAPFMDYFDLGDGPFGLFLGLFYIFGIPLCITVRIYFSNRKRQGPNHGIYFE